jgi:hypothetical protein
MLFDDGRVEIGSITLDVSGEFGSNPVLLDAAGLQFITQNLIIDIDNGTVTAGSFKLHADSAVLLPDENGGEGFASVEQFDVEFDLNGNLVATLDHFSASLVDAISVDGTGGTIQFGPAVPSNEPFLSFTTIGATIDGLAEALGTTPTVTIDNLALFGNGRWNLTGVRVSGLPDQNTLNSPIAEFLPFFVNNVYVDFDLDDDLETPVNFDQFEITVDGRFNIALLTSMFGGLATPVIKIGAEGAGQQEYSAANNGEVLGVVLSVDSLSQGKIAPKSIGPITLGVRDWTLGDFTFAAEITFGRYLDGVLTPLDIPGLEIDPQVTGFVQFLANDQMQSDSETADQLRGRDFAFDGFELNFAGAFDEADGWRSLTLYVDGDVDIGFSLGEFLELYGVNFDTTITLRTPVNDFDPDVDFELNSLGVDAAACQDCYRLPESTARCSSIPPRSSHISDRWESVSAWKTSLGWRGLSQIWISCPTDCPI